MCVSGISRSHRRVMCDLGVTRGGRPGGAAEEDAMTEIHLRNGLSDEPFRLMHGGKDRVRLQQAGITAPSNIYDLTASEAEELGHALIVYARMSRRYKPGM